MDRTDRTGRTDEKKRELAEILTPGTVVYTVLRQVSRTGLTRRLSCLVVQDGAIRDITDLVAAVTPFSLDRSGFLVVRGVGMDMGFHVVYELASVLFGNGYALVHRWV